jgi:hypothetical protein
VEKSRNVITQSPTYPAITWITLKKSLEPLENPFVVWKTRIVIMVSSHDSENWMRASANHVYCNLYSTILNFELEVKAKPFLWDFIF